MRRTLMTLLPVVALAAACSDNQSFTPTTPGGSTIPSIGGTYASPEMWRFERIPESTGTPIALTCGGTLTIATQVATSFTGTFQVLEPCGQIQGTVNSGTLRTDGAVTFGLGWSSPDPNFLTAAFGCTYVSGDTVLTGTISGNALQAQSTTVMECPSPGGRMTLNVRITGSRS